MKKTFTQALVALCLLIGNATFVKANDTIHLDDSAYGIDYVQAVYYTTAGNHFFTFLITKEATDEPTLQIEMKAPDKTHIQGSQEVVLKDFTWLDFTVDTYNDSITFSKVVFWLKFKEIDINGDPVYDILFVGDGSDDKVYKYKATIAIYAYDDDNGGAFLQLEDTVDDSVVEPVIDSGGATAIDSSSLQGGDRGRLILLDGQLFILRGDKVYTLTGAKVR